MKIIILPIICFLVIPVYYKTRAFNSINGILLFSLGFLALFLRILFCRKYPPLAILNRDTLSFSIVILLVPLVLFTILSLFKKGYFLKRRPSYFFKLLIPYLFFGALQQLFFLTIFTDSMYYTFSNFNIIFLLSVLFFFAFHLNWILEVKKFLPLLICFGILNAFIYLRLGNILPQMVMHGVAASIFYTAFSKKDQLKRRFS
jgi:hypothetical protein